MPGSLILMESAHKGGENGFMVFTVKSSLVPSLERGFHGEVKEGAKRAGLESNTPTTF
jgi:hypothetical protein